MASSVICERVNARKMTWFRYHYGKPNFSAAIIMGRDHGRLRISWLVKCDCIRDSIFNPGMEIF